MSRAAVRLAGALALSVSVAPGVAAQGGTWALTNARIETVTRGVIERGTIVIRNGLIVAVGAGVEVPPDARVLDLSGRTIMPGFIDLTSTLGLPAAAQPTGGPGGGAAAAASAGQQGQGPRFVGLEPHRVVADELRPQAADVRAARDAGITAALVAPNRGAFRGLSALVPLRDSVRREDVVRTPVGLHMGFQGTPGSYPATLLGVIAYQRQAFYDARRHGLLLERYRQNPRGMERPPNDPALNALVPYARGEAPVFFAADREDEIRRVLSIAREFGLDARIVGATEAFRVAPELAAWRRPVVISVDFPRAAQVTGWEYRYSMQRPLNDSAAADSQVTRLVEGNAAAAMRAGVRFALAPGGLRPNEFLANVRRAVAAGLPRDSALAALTIRAAEIAGANQQLGSIEEGKIANLVVARGDPLSSDSARIQMVFVDGIRYETTPPAAGAGARGAGAGGGGGRGAAAAGEMAQIAGTWITVTATPGGEVTSNMTLTQSGNSCSGQLANEMFNAPITSCEISGRTVTMTVTATIQGQTVTMTMRGEVDGDRMRGTISAGEFGEMRFTGERRPQ
ncbi:MAG TPA: amidohydrolase family protein [Gemmatimonadales bacterium]|nr:amidohydrolase family protein [Gemmatimonadales bacterium]